jgi:hypothetical protein
MCDPQRAARQSITIKGPVDTGRYRSWKSLWRFPHQMMAMMKFRMRWSYRLQPICEFAKRPNQQLSRQLAILPPPAVVRLTAPPSRQNGAMQFCFRITDELQTTHDVQSMRVYYFFFFFFFFLRKEACSMARWPMMRSVEEEETRV